MERKDCTLSVVVPVYNEEAVLTQFTERTIRTLDGMQTDYELLLVNDGSRDDTETVIRECVRRYPGVIRGVMLERNYGQHTAIVAGFSICRGHYVLTIDADLQNPPEEIPRLFAEIQKGCDTVGSYRIGRKDGFFRKFASRMVNIVVSRLYTGFCVRDYGCMLRIFTRDVTDGICMTHGKPTFIPVTAMAYTKKYAEIPVGHAPRSAGHSQYTPGRLVALTFDLLKACKKLKKQPDTAEAPATDYFRIREVI